MAQLRHLLESWLLQVSANLCPPLRPASAPLCKDSCMTDSRGHAHTAGHTHTRCLHVRSSEFLTMLLCAGPRPARPTILVSVPLSSSPCGLGLG